jgi:hypothetical protein
MTDSSTISERPRPALPRAPILPYEVIQLIIECYIQSRAEEVRKLRRDRINQEEDHSSAVTLYPILPMLTTSKWFHSATIPLIYKNISLNSSEAWDGFINRASFGSYRHVKQLYVDSNSGSVMKFRWTEQHSKLALVHLSDEGAYDVLESLNGL